MMRQIASASQIASTSQDPIRIGTKYSGVAHITRRVRIDIELRNARETVKAHGEVAAQRLGSPSFSQTSSICGFMVGCAAGGFEKFLGRGSVAGSYGSLVRTKLDGHFAPPIAAIVALAAASSASVGV